MGEKQGKCKSILRAAYHSYGKNLTKRSRRVVCLTALCLFNSTVHFSSDLSLYVLRAKKHTTAEHVSQIPKRQKNTRWSQTNKSLEVTAKANIKREIHQKRIRLQEEACNRSNKKRVLKCSSLAFLFDLVPLFSASLRADRTRPV